MAGLWRTIFLIGVFCALAVNGWPAERFTTLATFNGTDGDGPEGTLIQGLNGRLYGTTSGGGTSPNCIFGCGSIFEVTAGGQLTTVHDFDRSDGADPRHGTVFRLGVGLRPFIKTLPVAANVGASVIILGYHLGRARSVSFNGKHAAFTIISDTEIKATVPRGATTGRVRVKTHGATLISNVDFRVS
jgi:uncharacterized repeat protein (TIGR03803 family)